MFINDVRLCVRNLPLTVSAEDLRRVCLDFLGVGNKRCLTEAIQAKRNIDGTRLQVPSKLVSVCPTNESAQQPIIKRLRKGSASVGTCMLPKRLSIKKRHRARSSSTHVGASKPKKHLSRKQIRARKKM
ncbi:hypothetical protein P879_07863 [Paragonimus westermani]|uniref:Uncharacterized protein n=1 Tax=Paragonimus westermani TaxID=34504 RepID=A0A8T0DHN4_9TREM|nr:hypothetical protein P879_07863 [Paragonimus westermani]